MKRRPGHSREPSMTPGQREVTLRFANWWLEPLCVPIPDSDPDLRVFACSMRGNAHRRDVLYSLAYDGTDGP